jgi:hypothetical protein
MATDRMLHKRARISNTSFTTWHGHHKMIAWVGWVAGEYRIIVCAGYHKAKCNHKDNVQISSVRR